MGSSVPDAQTNQLGCCRTVAGHGWWDGCGSFVPEPAQSLDPANRSGARRSKTVCVGPGGSELATPLPTDPNAKCAFMPKIEAYQVKNK